MKPPRHRLRLLLLAAFVSGPAPLQGAPSISLERVAGRLHLSYSGVLQSAGAPGGPWADVSPAAQPHPIDPSLASLRFYRTRQATPDSVFSSASVVEWTLTGPFQQHFELAFAGMPDGIFPPRREKPAFEGLLAMDPIATPIPVTLRVRGNSSLHECPFPKLKLKVSKADRPGTPFFDAREIKIGTHCAEGGRGTVGRLREETATWREALAYEAMETLGFVSPRVRRARIDYHDTSVGHESEPGAWPVRRQALIFDDIEVVAERLGGRALADDEIAALTGSSFDEQTVADIQFLHALLGNWDYRLAWEAEGLWNTEVVQFPSGSLVPVAGDFDLSSWVTGTVRSSAPRDYHPELADVERQARFEVERLQGRLKPAAFASARGRFELRRSAVEARVRDGLVDDPGRANALRHLAAFHDALAALTPR